MRAAEGVGTDSTSVLTVRAQLDTTVSTYSTDTALLDTTVSTDTTDIADLEVEHVQDFQFWSVAL